MTKFRIGVMLIPLFAVPLTLGFVIGLGVGGYFAQKPYDAERHMINQKVFGDKNLSDRALSCAVVAWTHEGPVNDAWWQSCLRKFDSSH